MPTIAKISLVLKSTNVGDGTVVESMWIPLASASSSQVQKAKTFAVQAATARATLLGFGAYVSGVRISVFTENPDGSLTRLAQILEDNKGQGWLANPVQWFNIIISHCLAQSSCRAVGAKINRFWLLGNSNLLRKVGGVLAYPPYAITNDGEPPVAQNVGAACNNDIPALQARYTNLLSQYVKVLTDNGVFSRAIAPRQNFAIIAFTNSNPATGVSGTMTVQGNQLSVFKPGTKIRISARSRKGKRTLAPETAIRGPRQATTVALDTNGNTVIGISCSFTGTVDPCLYYQLSPTVLQHNPLNDIVFEGYGKSRRAAHAPKR